MSPQNDKVRARGSLPTAEHSHCKNTAHNGPASAAHWCECTKTRNQQHHRALFVTCQRRTTSRQRPVSTRGTRTALGAYMWTYVSPQTWGRRTVGHVRCFEGAPGDAPTHGQKVPAAADDSRPRSSSTTVSHFLKASVQSRALHSSYK